MSQPPLNPAQREAVEHFTGPILVLAGAGSGKTRVITHRVVRLLERGVPPTGIVALTFTNKAAAEMRERIAKEVGKGACGNASIAKQLTISTFHSFGLQILTREKAHLGRGTFTIFDQGDQMGAIKELLARVDYGKRFDASVIATRISNAKNAFLSAEELPEREGDDYDAITKILYPRYQSALKGFHAFDFDDLVCEVARLWQAKPDVLARWQEKHPFLLVDEYQDTNRAQLEVLRLLAGERKNLCVVGDDDQAIYGWRGADVSNILEFDEQFGAKVVKLEQNYRSRKPILDVANSIVDRRSDTKHKKVLFTDKVGGDKVQSCIAASPEGEARWVAAQVQRAIKDMGTPPREVAILYRSNGQAKALEEALRELGVGHKVVGGQQFFERKEVKDLFAYLKLAMNRSDEISLRRIVNYPPRGIGETSIDRLALNATAKGWSLWQAIERVDAIDEISGPARDGCKALEKIIADTRRDLMVSRLKPSEAARALCDRLGLRQELDATSPSPAASARRWANVEGILQLFARREIREENKGADPADGFASFLHLLTLDFNSDEGGEDKTNLVTLSTLHGSKGLEFDVVFLVGCEEGLLPHSRTLDARATDDVPTTHGDKVSADIEEERRLFYVGVTRAKKNLTITRSKARVVRGKPVARTPSRFVLEIPPELVEEREVNPDAPMSMAQLAEQANALLAALEGLG
jgi:DNA helicase-2/ATP-dependent DNA helicase PcrA